MKAMIFAAGVGLRLKPWTLSHPKALVEVGGLPMLQRVIEKLRDAGVDRMVVNVHHFANQIVDFLAANDNFGIDIAISNESSLLLDTGGGLLRALPLLGNDDEPLIIHNVDILTDEPVIPMVQHHLSSGAAATLLVSDRRKSSRALLFDKLGMMKGWINLTTGALKPSTLTCGEAAHLQPLAFGGVHVVNLATIGPALQEYAKRKAPDGVFSITDFYISTCHDLAISAYTQRSNTQWFDIGKPETLAVARQSLTT